MCVASLEARGLDPAGDTLFKSVGGGARDGSRGLSLLCCRCPGVDVGHVGVAPAPALFDEGHGSIGPELVAKIRAATSAQSAGAEYSGV